MSAEHHEHTHTHTHTKLDGVGLWLSGLCAVHCMVMPVVLIFFPVMSWIHWSRLADIIVLTVAAVIGLGGCLLGYRHHRSLMPVCFVVTGLAFNATGRLASAALGPVLAQTLTAGGPLFMAYGMWRDRQSCTSRVHIHDVSSARHPVAQPPR